MHAYLKLVMRRSLYVMLYKHIGDGIRRLEQRVAGLVRVRYVVFTWSGLCRCCLGLWATRGCWSGLERDWSRSIQHVRKEESSRPFLDLHRPPSSLTFGSNVGPIVALEYLCKVIRKTTSFQHYYHTINAWRSFRAASFMSRVQTADCSSRITKTLSVPSSKGPFFQSAHVRKK